MENDMAKNIDTSAPTGVADLPAEHIVSCGDVSCEFLVDPIPRPKPTPFAVRMRPSVRSVTLVDNQKPNSLEILRMAQDVLRARGVTVTDDIVRKPSAGTPVQGRLLGQLSEERGLLLLGVND
jgi:hypothetical protein